VEKDWPTLVVGGLFFLLGAIFCCVAAWLFLGERIEAARLADGGKARGEVLRKLIVADRTQGSFVRPKHRIEYRFVPARGEPVSAEADIEPALWQRLGKGDPVEVHYLPADPAEHGIEGMQRDWVITLVFALIGGFFAPVGFWLARNGLTAKDAPARPQRGFVRWLNTNPPLALGVIGLLFFLPFLAGGVGWSFMASTESGEFASRAQATEGTVISKQVVRKSRSTGSTGRSGGHSTHYHAIYRYLADGVQVVGTSSLDSDDWESLKERGPIAVTYVAGKPWVHYVGGEESGRWIGPLIFLAIGGFGMAGCGYSAWRGWRRRGAPPPRRPEARPLQPAPAAAATTPPASPAKPTGGNWIVWLVGAVFFAAGSSLAVSGLLDLFEERRFEADGQLVEARIVGKDIQQADRGERRSTAYTVTYRFSTKEGGSAEGRAVLKPDAWEKAKPGDGLRVQYLPARPEASRLQGESLWVDAIVALLVGPVFALLGALALLGAWLNRRDPHG
jgi:hypothetical protein